MKAKRVGRYGMKWSTIKYWQQQARRFYTQRGMYPGRAIIEEMDDKTAPSLIGHAMIQFAAVASREHIIASLTRTRRGRWLL